jgi:mevalonate kinase
VVRAQLGVRCLKKLRKDLSGAMGAKATPLVEVSAPGKVILFGEHAVVHGRRAVAASASDLRLYVKIEILSGPELELALPDLSEDPFQFPLHELLRELLPLLPEEPRSPSADALAELEDLLDAAGKSKHHKSNSRAREALLPMLFICSSILVPSLGGRGARITARSLSLPIGAGLGSSAALCVAVSTAARVGKLKLGGKWQGEAAGPDRERPYKEELDLINRWAYAGETIIHGNPSGIDNSVSCYGGCVCFRRQPQHSEAVQHVPCLDILLTNTLVEGRNTRFQVERVGRLLQRFPEAVNHVLDAIDAISRRFLAGELSAEGVGDLMLLNHHALCALGVGHPKLDAVLGTAARYGCPGKLTGAGGGGCMITLLPVDLADAKRKSLEDELRSQGFDCLRSALGGVGVIVHTASISCPPLASQKGEKVPTFPWLHRLGLLGLISLSLAWAATSTMSKRRR